MVSHSSHTNHEFLMLVVQFTNVSFAIENFVIYEKALIILVSFLFFNMVNLLKINL